MKKENFILYLLIGFILCCSIEPNEELNFLQKMCVYSIAFLTWPAVSVLILTLLTINFLF